MGQQHQKKTEHNSTKSNVNQSKKDRNEDLQKRQRTSIKSLKSMQNDLQKTLFLEEGFPSDEPNQK